jgi:TM2 domain-containing membrane protein YozV
MGDQLPSPPASDRFSHVSGDPAENPFPANRLVIEPLRYRPYFHLMDSRTDTHSKTIGYLLWIFGFSGAHRFYYGRPVTGVIWFFTAGLFLIGWIVDLFLIPSMDRAADRKFNAGQINYSVAWILLTFLGWAGIHRFYMGKWGTGLIYLFTLGLFGFGVLYDFLTLNTQISERNG